MPIVRIVEGRYKRKRVHCQVADCDFAGRRRFRIPEEKQTDVAIGVHMLDDAYRDRCDRLIVVSGDSDLIPAVKMVKRRFGTKMVHVYVPARDPRRGAAKELRAEADNDRTLPNELVTRCQFPDEIETPTGVISKPPEWSEVGSEES